MADRSLGRWRPAVLLLAVLVGTFVASAFLAALIHGALAGSESGVAGFILEKGPHKLMRRIMMLLVLPFLPVLLRSAGWQGWADTGQSADPGRRIDPAWRHDLGIGLVIGTVSLGVMGMLGLLAGTRAWAPDLSGEAVLILVGTAATAMLIGWLEETAVRGILFRCLERLWRLVPAVVVSSLLFSSLHFLKASPAAFDDGSLLEQTLAAMGSALSNPLRTRAFLPRFLNLTLMGVVLCLFVYRTRTIWVAAGTHAAWVWIKKLNSVLTEGVPDAAGGWMGIRSDFTDSPATVVMFIILAGMGLRWLPSRGQEELR